MTETERKALALVNEVRAEYPLVSSEVASNLALCRAIEQHDAYRQEVSDDVALAVDRTKQIKGNSSYVVNHMHKYIIAAKPDPLVAAIDEMGLGCADIVADQLRTALAARGGRIVFDGDAA